MDKKRTIRIVTAVCFTIVCGILYLVFCSPFGRSDEIVFENVYTAPIIPVPETGDNSVAGLWMLISLAFISGAVMLLTGKSLLEKE